MAVLHPYLVAVACVLAWCGAVSAYYDPLTPSLQQVPGVPSPDSETISYLIPRLAHKYRPPTGGWVDVADPRLYLLTETDNEEPQTQGEEGPRRLKRTGLGGNPSLSIVNPLEVLRQRLMLEIARRRMRQSEEKVHSNREWLKSIGKRSLDTQQDNMFDKLIAMEAEEGRNNQDGSSRWTSTS